MERVKADAKLSSMVEELEVIRNQASCNVVGDIIPLHWAQTAKAWKMLDEMKDQVKAGQSGLDSVAANLITLEEVSDELKAQNARLAKQFKELAKKPAKESTPGTAAADVPQPDTPVEQTSTPHEGGMYPTHKFIPLRRTGPFCD
ncbi:hypothetical protein TI39_contig400g00002 [Zymoseptoria brevis]|uniref:Uncharacterized protein n=1 Tax=Zymoseptoria brevis TaxID=1047168 RepID=A0A0F4GMH2_9PEZI|nr:hypothetical protein TI39_contig400g00002 [Zymoseptoria brevis]